MQGRSDVDKPTLDLVTDPVYFATYEDAVEYVAERIAHWLCLPRNQRQLVRLYHISKKRPEELMTAYPPLELQQIAHGLSIDPHTRHGFDWRIWTVEPPEDINADDEYDFVDEEEASGRCSESESAEFAE